LRRFSPALPEPAENALCVGGALAEAVQPRLQVKQVALALCAPRRAGSHGIALLREAIDARPHLQQGLAQGVRGRARFGVLPVVGQPGVGLGGAAPVSRRCREGA
jgi:hypothetical protein